MRFIDFPFSTNYFRLKEAIEKFGLDEEEFGRTLANAMKRYIFYISEKDIEEDILNDMNAFYMMNNYSSIMTDILKSVSKLNRAAKIFSSFLFYYHLTIIRPCLGDDAMQRIIGCLSMARSDAGLWKNFQTD